MKKYLLTWLLLLWVVIAHATTYYISNEGLTGNNGQSPGASWPLSKFNGNNFTSDDNVLFLKGEIFLGVNTFLSSGTSGHPITIDLYGTSTNNAWLDGQASTTAATLRINGNYVVVNNIVIQNSLYGNGIVLLPSAVHDITFFNCYINTGIRGINAVNCGSGGIANLLINACYFTNITDVDDGTGKFTYGGGNHIQFNNCNGSGMEIKNNFCYTLITVGSSTTPFVGDIISIYQCNGTSSSNILVHHNQVRGGGSSTPASPGGGGKAGIVLGDVGGTYQYAHDNTLVNAGASEMLVQGGTFIIMSNNIMFGVSQPYTVVGFAYGNYSGVAANNNTMANNIINTKNTTGGQSNIYIDQATGSSRSTATGLVGGPTLALPTGWASNTTISAVDPTAFDAMLANPLWTGSPWNTITTPTTQVLMGRTIIVH